MLAEIACIVLAFHASVHAQQQPTPCLRWGTAHAIAGSGSEGSLPNSTLYLFGGQYRTSPGQTQNTWTNSLLSLDLTSDWPAGSPALTVLKHSGSFNPPALSLGALWASKDGSELYQYGGEASDKPRAYPPADATLRYDISSATWSTTTTSGDKALRTAEGASAFAPGSGTNAEPLAFYAFGHLDSFTSPTFAYSTPRIYLDSLLQFDVGATTYTNYSSFEPGNGHTGATNAVSEGTPTFRADGTLTYVPGLGTNAAGILVAISGGAQISGQPNQTIDNSGLDVFDIGAKTWLKQATTGDIMPPRVNSCAVRGSSIVNNKWQHQIFVYGGQNINLTTQNSDVYVLTLPEYEWTYVGGSDMASAPSARAGHTCELIGSQMLVIGGWQADDIECDSQPVYILNVTSMKWVTTFRANQTDYVTSINPPAIQQIMGGGQPGHGSSSGGEGSQPQYGPPYASPSDPQLIATTMPMTQTNTTKATSTSAGKLADSDQSANVRTIVIGVVAAVIGLGIIAAIVFFIVRKQKQREFERGHHRMGSDMGDDFDDDAQSIFEVEHPNRYSSFGTSTYALPGILQSIPSKPSQNSSDATQGSHEYGLDDEYNDPFDETSFPSNETQNSHASSAYYAGRRREQQEEDRVSLVAKHERPTLRHRPSTNSNPSSSNGPSPSSSFRKESGWKSKLGGRPTSSGASTLGLDGYEVQGSKLAPKRTLGVVNH